MDPGYSFPNANIEDSKMIFTGYVTRSTAVLED